MIIDAHVYSLPSRLSDPIANLPETERHIIQAIYRHPESHCALKLSSPANIKESMEKSGINQSVLVTLPWSDPQLCMETNDHVLNQSSRDSSFLALCAIQPLDPCSIKEAERCFAAKAIGLKVNPNWQGFALNSPEMDQIAKIVEIHGKILMIHVDHTFKASIASPANLFQFAQSHPGMRIIAAHMGGGLGLYNLNNSVSKNIRNVWFDTAVSATLKMVEIYVDIGLDQKIIFGSDFPFNHSHEQAQVVKGIKQLNLESSIEERIFKKNFDAMLSHE